MRIYKELKTNIPKTFTLMGQTITVEEVASLVNSSDNRGEAVFRENIIRLQKDSEGLPVPRDQYEHTFFHELVHFIFYLLGKDELRDDEELVGAFSGLLHQAMITAKYDKE